MEPALKRVDQLRHELKALRYLLDAPAGGRLAPAELPQREDFQFEQTRQLYDAIMQAPDSDTARSRVAALELDEIDLQSFLSLSGAHYYSYPALVKRRAAAIREGELAVEEE